MTPETSTTAMAIFSLCFALSSALFFFFPDLDCSSFSLVLTSSVHLILLFLPPLSTRFVLSLPVSFG
eukprot:m.288739 g.288739  ORF g.288739 m.288739 type:complete len:67 (+) comp55053_c0_seq3:280-480(+)